MKQTLLLNASYEPLKIVHWQKAITLWCQGKVEIISVYDREVRAVSFSFKLPSVIRLLRYIRIKRRFDYVPFFWSAHYDVSINYVGHAERWDDVKVDGDAAARDVAVLFERAGKPLALATIFRDGESLAFEVELERAADVRGVDERIPMTE